MGTNVSPESMAAVSAAPTAPMPKLAPGTNTGRPARAAEGAGGPDARADFTNQLARIEDQWPIIFPFHHAGRMLTGWCAQNGETFMIDRDERRRRANREGEGYRDGWPVNAAEAE